MHTTSIQLLHLIFFVKHFLEFACNYIPLTATLNKNLDTMFDFSPSRISYFSSDANFRLAIIMKAAKPMNTAAIGLVKKIAIEPPDI